MNQYYYFAIASDWEHDWDFIRLLEENAAKKGISTFVVWPKILEKTIAAVRNGELKFGFYFDRASDTSPEFLQLQQLMILNEIPVFDEWQHLKWAADKAVMHYKFIESGIKTPNTIIVPPFQTEENIRISDNEISQLKIPFIIKPANSTGGGQGVVRGAEKVEDILIARQTRPSEKYVLQEKIIPLEQDGRRFWFRGFYTCGIIQSVWWNDLTHVYDTLSEQEVEKFQLYPLFEIVQQIANTIKLNFFSTEIVVNRDKKFIAVDYVNEVCDMRLKSRHIDGVPDEIVEKIVNKIVSYVSEKYARYENLFSR
jgi:hypothetical protein